MPIYTFTCKTICLYNTHSSVKLYAYITACLYTILHFITVSLFNIWAYFLPTPWIFLKTKTRENGVKNMQILSYFFLLKRWQHLSKLEYLKEEAFHFIFDKNNYSMLEMRLKISTVNIGNTSLTIFHVCFLKTLELLRFRQILCSFW